MSVTRKSPRAKGISSSLRRRLLLASSVIMLGGICIAIIQSGSPDSGGPAVVSEKGSADAIESRGPVARQESVVDASLPALDLNADNTKEKPLSRALLRAAAISELESHLQTGTSRMQRIAGGALARISHPKALGTLLLLLKTEDSDLARIDIAYGLARGKNVLGREYLVSELSNKRRDVRIDAGRRLTQLGDDAGRKTLQQMLRIRSHRLGAASVLALLGDEEGLALLRSTLSDKKSSEENRMRAAVALGRSGDGSVKPALLLILEDSRYVVDAAGALAALSDSSAIPALQRQLQMTSMRVSAAESLALMRHEIDLRDLAAALVTGNALGRITAAEAILVLTLANLDDSAEK